MNNVATLKDNHESESLPELTPQQLNKWLSSPPENSRRVTITPHVAELVLADLNKGNRTKKPEEIRRYAQYMKDGRWALTGESIKFGTDGMLKDGQNRLSACLQAGVSFQTHVVFGIDPNVFANIDRGKNRNPADVFHIAGITYPSDTAATVRWLLLIANGEVKSRTTFQPDHLLREYRGYNAVELEKCVKVARRIRTNTKQPPGPLAATYYLARQKSPEEADKFFKNWADGSPHVVQQKLQRKLMKMASENNGRVHDVVRTAMLVQAWNHFVKGQKGAMTKFDWSLKMPFPNIQH
jgi:hypothetical protein